MDNIIKNEGLLHALKMISPGTPLRKGIENVLRAKTGGLIVLDSNEEVMKTQKEAWLLINPRIVDDPIAQVTFPSQTFEYLLSATPVLTTKLNGYGVEYRKYMFFSESDSPDSLAKAISDIRATSMLSLKQKADDAKTFIIEEKSWRYQCKKIAEFI